MQCKLFTLYLLKKYIQLYLHKDKIIKESKRVNEEMEKPNNHISS